MRIAVDVMSGDRKPEELIEGAVKAAGDFDVEVVLTGSAALVDRYADSAKGVCAAHSGTVVTMEDSPLSAVRDKPDSSMAVGIDLLRRGEADAFVSPGNTGALLSASTIMLRRVKGIRRAAIGAVLALETPFIIVDAGANVEVLPDNLLNFAYMGSLYAENVLEIKNPRVGLLSNGTEDCKGTPLTKAAFALLRESGLNFAGNVESRDLPFGCCDVLVCDGFTGNITLKLMEGMGRYMSRCVEGLFRRSALTKLSYLACRRDIKLLKKKTDVGEYGGAPLLGIAKPVIKAHGNSDSKCICNAVRRAKAYAESGIIEKFEAKFRRVETNEQKSVSSAD